VSLEDVIARALEDTGRFRILRKIEPRPIVERSSYSFPYVGVITDAETTGLDPEKDEIIELGITAFTFSESRIGDVIGRFSSFREPSFPIPEEITALTGITNEMVKGHVIPLDQVREIVDPATLVTAHNASFDRGFCERLDPIFEAKNWACSKNDIDWRARGFEGSKLGYLLSHSGMFHNGHRAGDDCDGLLEVLDHPSNGSRPFAEMLANSIKITSRIFATNAPFHLKDVLARRGYTWSDGSRGRPKAWWIDIEESKVDSEMSFLQTAIYNSATPVRLPTYRMTAKDRYRSWQALQAA